MIGMGAKFWLPSENMIYNDVSKQKSLYIN